MKTKSFIIPQGTIKDFNNEDNIIPNEILFTILALKDSIDIDHFDTSYFPKLDLYFPQGFPTGIQLIQTDFIYKDQNEADLHFRLSFNKEALPKVQSFVQDELEVLGDPEFTNGASARVIEPFCYIDFYIAIPF